MNELQICSFEQALRLKKLGFSWETIYFYILEDELRKPYPFYVKFCFNDNCYGSEPQNYNSFLWERKGIFSAPTVALALKWIRDEKGMCGTVRTNFNRDFKCSYYVSIDYVSRKPIGYNWCEDWINKSICYDTYESAESALLNELLTILEK